MSDSVNTKSRSSLSNAGIAYIIGDASLATAKIMEKDYHGASGASLWAIGGAAAALFGNPTAEKQLHLFERRLSDHIKKQGIILPKDPTPAALAEKGGIIDHISAFLYTYPSEMLNAVYAIGGAMTFKGGWNKNNRMDVASGALITAGALAGLLIPEKKPDPNHPAETMIGKIWESVRAKPLRVSGLFYAANNIPMAWEAGKKIYAGKTSGYPRLLTAAIYIFGNLMLMLSSRDTTGAKDTEKNTKMLEALAEKSAFVVAAQPKNVQEALVGKIAEYLSVQLGNGKTAAEITDLLHGKLAEIGKPSPAGWQKRVEDKPGAMLQTSL